MPNGFHGTEEEWRRLEAPLLELDDALDSFAREHGMRVERNYHGREPNRMLRWTSGGFEKTIQISLEDIDKRTAFIALYAWKDTDRKRYSKHGPTAWGVPFTRLRTELPRLLLEGRQTLEALTAGELEFTNEAAPEVDFDRAVVLRVYKDAGEADAASGRLQAAGIPTYVVGNKDSAGKWLSRLRPAKWQLLVNPSDCERAENLLGET